MSLTRYDVSVQPPSKITVDENGGLGSLGAGSRHANGVRVAFVRVALVRVALVRVARVARVA